MYRILTKPGFSDADAIPERYSSFLRSLSRYLPDTFTEPDRRITGMLLNVTQQCNMICTYCYAGGGSYGFSDEQANMSEDTAFQAVDLLIRLSKDAFRLNVTFFGGEPLMNFDLIPKVVSYAQKRAAEHGKKFTFSVVTNGTLLDERICQYLTKNRILLVISLDGDKEINDRTKKFEPSHYDIVMRNLQHFKDKRLLAVRATLSKANYLHINHIIDSFTAHGFPLVQFEEISPATERQSLIFTEQDNPILLEMYEEAYKRLVGDISVSDTKNIHPFMQEIFRIAFKRKDVHGCSAGRRNLAISCQGEIYPCHRMVGDKKRAVGMVKEPFDWEMLEPYYRADITHKVPCKTCWARYLCSGGCVHAALVRNGDLSKPDELQCMRKKRLIELAAYHNLKLNKAKLFLCVPNILHSLRVSPGHLLKQQDWEYAEQMEKNMGGFLMNQLLSRVSDIR